MSLTAALLLIAMPAAPAAAPKEPGALEEWQQVEGLRPGDMWMKMRIYVDRKGRPTKCRTIDSNIRKDETRWWVCNAMMADWKTQPIMENGVAVEGSVVRVMILPGRSTSDAWARKKKEAGKR